MDRLAASACRWPRLEVRHIRFGYRARCQVLDNVSLRVDAGEVHCLLGRSGCGKTTLLRLIAGLERQDAGVILVDGKEVAGERRHVRPERRAVGMVFQDFALFPNLSARKNVMFGMCGVGRAARRARADELLQAVGMGGLGAAMPHTLSGGQQQRVAVARSLAREPAVMLLDEPFSSLDAQLRSEVRTQTIGLLRARGVATLMVTHDPAEAELVGDRVTSLGAPGAAGGEVKSPANSPASEPARCEETVDPRDRPERSSYRS